MYSYEELGISRKFSVINQKIRHMFDSEFSQSEVTGTQAAILHFIFLKHKYEDVYQRDIEAEFHIRSSSATSVLSGLERNGFICRENASQDSRMKRLMLTPKAVNIAEQIQRDMKHINETILSGFSSDETVKLVELLSKVDTNIPQSCILHKFPELWQSAKCYYVGRFYSMQEIIL